tara:strand:- start:416 stop:574 length:159 start_codon:yes stop_codon:yes gene_type:complete
MKLLFALILIALAAGVYFYPAFRLWLVQDSCLDRGGAWQEDACTFRVKANEM